MLSRVQWRQPDTLWYWRGLGCSFNRNATEHTQGIIQSHAYIHITDHKLWKMHGCVKECTNHTGCPSTLKTVHCSSCMYNTRAHCLLLMRTTRNFQKVREKRMDVPSAQCSTIRVWELNNACGSHIRIRIHMCAQWGGYTNEQLLPQAVHIHKYVCAYTVYVWYYARVAKPTTQYWLIANYYTNLVPLSYVVK